MKMRRQHIEHEWWAVWFAKILKAVHRFLIVKVLVGAFSRQCENFAMVRWQLYCPQQSTGAGVQATTRDWKLKETNCRVFIILATIMPADVCEINNHPSVVREIIEHILKARYQQKLKSGDGRHQYNENKLAPQSDWDKRGVSILCYHGFSPCHPLDKTEIVDKK